MTETKPPIGLEPEYIHIERRRDAIIDAIGRYEQAGVKVPKAWEFELFRIDSDLMKLRGFR